MATPASTSLSRVGAVTPSGVAQSYANQTYSSTSQGFPNASYTSNADMVTISNSGQARSLYQQGRSLEQIAVQLGLDLETVRQFVSRLTESVTTQAERSIESMNNLVESANPGPSVESLIGYVGYGSKTTTQNTPKVYSGLA